MNIIYKVVFNKSLGIFTAVSELGKSHTKTKTCNRLLKFGLLSSPLFISIHAFSASATSINYVDIANTDTSTTTATANNSIAIGQGASVANVLSQKAIAIGLNSSVNLYSELYDTATNSRKGRFTGASSIAIGDNSTTYGSDSIALGHNTNATGWSAIAIGNAAKTSATTLGGIHNEGAVAIGQEAISTAKSVSVGSKSYATGFRSVAIGDEAQVLDYAYISSTTFNDNIKNYTKAVADNLRKNYSPAGKEFYSGVTANIGDLVGSGNGGTAVGYRAKAAGWGATAFGMQAYALNSQTTSLGDDSKALGYAASSLGTGAYTFGTYAAAVGTRSEAVGDYALAFGTATSASGTGSIAMGYGVSASGKDAIAIGRATTRSKGWSTKGEIYQPAEHDVWNASGDYSVALGSDSVASEESSIAVGKSAKSSHTRSVALGDSSISEAAVNTANATINSITYGNFAGATSVGTVSVGNSTTKETRQIKNVSAGEISETSTDAINGSQLYVIAKDLASNSYSGFNLTTAKSAGEVSGKTVKKIGSNETVTIDAGKNISLTQTGSKISVATKDDVEFKTVNVGNKVKVSEKGINAGNTKVTGVADGDISPASKEAVNGSQLYALKQQIINGAVNDTSASISEGSDALTVTKGATTTVDNTKVTDYVIDLSQTTKDNIQKGVDAKEIVDNKGVTFAGDVGTTNAQTLGSTVEMKGDENITTKASGKKVSVSLNKNVKVDSVTTGDTTVNNDGITINNGSTGNQVSLTKNGLNNGGNRITQVADGKNDTDAVNLRQLKQVDSKVNRVDHKLRAGIAQAGAMANIPQVTRNGGSGVGFGVANYRGESAVSVGYSRLSDNGHHIIKGSVSVDSRGFGMAGAGYMYQW